MKPTTIARLQEFRAKVQDLIGEATALDDLVDVEALDVSGPDGDEYELACDTLLSFREQMIDALDDMDRNFPDSEAS